MTGRSFTSYLEQRYVSTQQYFVNPDLSYSIKVRHEESLASDKSWNQIVEPSTSIFRMTTSPFCIWG